jgi:hypothetical protein
MRSAHITGTLDDAQAIGVNVGDEEPLFANNIEPLTF